MQPNNNNGASTAAPSSATPENPLSFPKAADKPRLTAYAHYDQLYAGNHYKAFAIKAEKGFTEKYSQLRYITANFAGIISRIMADMLFGDNLTFDCEDDTNQTFLDALVEDNHLIAQLYESELNNSRRGDVVFKMRVGPMENSPTAESGIIIEEVPASIYFPTLDVASARFTPKEDVLIWQFTQNGNTYLHKETHRPGYIFHEIYRYDPNKEQIIATEQPEAFGFKPQEETGIDDSLIFHVPNFRDGDFFGASDYRDLEQLMFALNNRITKIDNILDKHSDPILAVPPGVIDENGQVKKEALSMFEVDNESTGFNKPEYIVWNANLQYAFKEVDKLLDMLYMFSGIAPASTGYSGDQTGGQAESGRALKFKLLATIRKRNQKKLYYDIVIKEMLETAMELAIAHKVKMGDTLPASAEKPTINWGDGIMNDSVEQVEMTIKRIEAGTMSRADAIVELDNISPEDAAIKVTEIDKEDAIQVPSLLKPAQPGRPALPAGANQPANPVPPGTPAVTPAPAGK